MVTSRKKTLRKNQRELDRQIMIGVSIYNGG